MLRIRALLKTLLACALAAHRRRHSFLSSGSKEKPRTASYPRSRASSPTPLARAQPSGTLAMALASPVPRFVACPARPGACPARQLLHLGAGALRPSTAGPAATATLAGGLQAGGRPAQTLVVPHRRRRPTRPAPAANATSSLQARRPSPVDAACECVQVQQPLQQRQQTRETSSRSRAGAMPAGGWRSPAASSPPRVSYLRTASPGNRFTPLTPMPAHSQTCPMAARRAGVGSGCGGRALGAEQRRGGAGAGCGQALPCQLGARQVWLLCGLQASSSVFRNALCRPCACLRRELLPRRHKFSITALCSSCTALAAHPLYLIIAVLPPLVLPLSSCSISSSLLLMHRLPSFPSPPAASSSCQSLETRPFSSQPCWPCASASGSASSAAPRRWRP